MIIIFVVAIIFIFVSLWCLHYVDHHYSDNDSTAIVVIGTVCLFVSLFAEFSFTQIFLLINNNPLIVFAVFAAYILIGFLWSLIKWYILNVKIAKAIKRFKEEGRERYIIEYMQGKGFNIDVVDGKPIVKVRDYYHALFLWFTYWPLSIIMFFFDDFMVAIFNCIYKSANKIYSSISNRVLRDIEDV